MNFVTIGDTEVKGIPPLEIMKLFSKYMDKAPKLNKKERTIYCSYFDMLINPRYIVDPSKINMEDMIHANKPGAIIRRYPGS